MSSLNKTAALICPPCKKCEGMREEIKRLKKELADERMARASEIQRRAQKSAEMVRRQGN